MHRALSYELADVKKSYILYLVFNTYFLIKYFYMFSDSLNSLSVYITRSVETEKLFIVQSETNYCIAHIIKYF